MLNDIICGKESSPIVVLEDCVDVDGLSSAGLPLAACFMENYCRKADLVYLVITEKSSAMWEKFLPSGVFQQLEIIDMFQNPSGWLGSPDNQRGVFNVDSDLVSLIQKNIRTKKLKNCAVIFESLSPIIIQKGVSYTCQMIKKLSQMCSDKDGMLVTSPVFCHLHGDMHDEHIRNLIRHISSTVLKTSTSNLKEYSALCSVFHRKTTGKIVKSAEYYNVSEGLEITVSEKKSIVPISESSEDDPTKNLTFNLSLTDKEKQARSNVTLPHTRGHLQKSEVTIHTQVESKIFYQADDADDFDEEDPDDDLAI